MFQFKCIDLFVFILLFQTLGLSAEVDQFTRRNEPIPDSLKILNEQLEELITSAIDSANQDMQGILGTQYFATPCDSANEKIKKKAREALFTHLKKKLTNDDPYNGVLEGFAKKDKRIKRKQISFQESIYSTSLQNKLISSVSELSPVININGIQIGTDKLGHFLSQGYTTYNSAKQTLSTERAQQILTESKNLEQTYQGLDTTGVKSYADIAANYQGALFWSKICGFPPNKAELEATVYLDKMTYFKNYQCEKESFVECKNGRWRRNENTKINLADFVDHAWDEGINCSQYANKTMAEAVYLEMNKRASETLVKSRKSPCPVDIVQCSEIRKKYGANKVNKTLISPVCSQEAENLKRLIVTSQTSEIYVAAVNGTNVSQQQKTKLNPQKPPEGFQRVNFKQ